MSEYITLPTPDLSGGIPLYKAISSRRSIRNFTSEALNLEQISQLLFSAQGKNHKRFRVVPSAGATYPLDIYLVLSSNSVLTMDAGVYHYLVEDHVLFTHRTGDFRQELSEAALKQQCVLKAPLNIVLTGEYSRTNKIYGDRAIQYINQEIGHAAQNVSLAAISMRLGSVMVGAFNDDDVLRILNCPTSYKPLYIISLGYPL